ncbi:uclacyanin 1-like [Lolium rigidum]|uniref:uclacyanin 1-like n=1 Tax=Lolium rigidum TaxID=89674 RepID=UPI001F5D4960|nr:uclacyanin 1-like [Lolium rigidum]
MAAAMKITLALAAMAILSTASAMTYNVGEPAGEWGFGINYGSWASSKQFIPGDSIVFKYSPQAHDVLEVSKADYDSCSAANPMTTLKTGNDVVALPATTSRKQDFRGNRGYSAAQAPPPLFSVTQRRSRSREGRPAGVIKATSK